MCTGSDAFTGGTNNQSAGQPAGSDGQICGCVLHCEHLCSFTMMDARQLSSPWAAKAQNSRMAAMPGTARRWREERQQGIALLHMIVVPGWVATLNKTTCSSDEE